MVGTTLSHYRIEDELGRGGMGIVYRAFDTRLERTVALKVLPSGALTTDEDRARFYREAKAAAQLSHPNICQVYEVDEAASEEGGDARPFIVMEYIEGETLAARIARGPLKIADAVRIASEIAEALGASHAKDIVHRDIKSGNVMLTDDGRAKVLDFGLAKTAASTKLTRMGSTVGTVAYMSPEQARGEEVDRRTDLYSLGVVLYEMVSGHLPFPGDYEQAVVYGILNEDPEPLTAVRTGVPMALEWIATKLLSKETDFRYQTAADLLADLKRPDLSTSGGSTRSMAGLSNAPTRSRARSVPAWMWGVVGGVAVVAGIVGWFARPAPGPAPRSPIHVALELENAEPSAVAWSPDETKLAYKTPEYIAEYDFSTGTTRRIPGTDGGGGPLYSPDGRQLVFKRAGEVVWLRPGSDSGVTVADSITGSMYGWLSETEFAFGSPRGVLSYDTASGVLRTVIPADSVRLPDRAVVVSPDRRFVYWLDPGRWHVWKHDLRSGKETGGQDLGLYVYTITSDWLALYRSMEGPMAVRFLDPETGDPAGPPTPAFIPQADISYDVSRSGHLVYLKAETFIDVGTVDEPLYYVNRGRRVSIIGLVREDTPIGEFAVTPDGRFVIIEAITDAGCCELYRYEIASGSAARLLPDAFYGEPAVSGDAQSVYFHRVDDDRGSIQKVAVRGLRSAVDVVAGNTDDRNPAVDAAETIVVFQRRSSDTGWDIWMKALDTGEERALVTFAGDQTDAALSPDGRLLAFQSVEGENVSILLRTLDDERTLEIGTGIVRPQFAKDGASLLFLDESRKTVYEEPVGLSASPQPSRGREIRYSNRNPLHIHYAPAPGEHPLIVAFQGPSPGQSSSWEVVFNWTSQFKRPRGD